MQHIKNLVDYIPEDGDIGIRYIKDSNGDDWYEIQDKFEDDTLKILYNSKGNVLYANVDVSTLVPYNGDSVLELEFNQDLAKNLSEHSTVIQNYVVMGDELLVQPSEYHVYEDGEWVISKEDEELLSTEAKDSRLKALKQIKELLLDEGFNFMGNIQSCSSSEIAKLNLLIEDLKDFEANNPDLVATRTVLWNFADGGNRELMLFEIEMLRLQVVAWVKAIEQTQANILKGDVVINTEEGEDEYIKFKSEAQNRWMEMLD